MLAYLLVVLAAYVKRLRVERLARRTRPVPVADVSFAGDDGEDSGV
jgi:hypothetical protein